MDLKRIADVFSSLSERPLAEGGVEGAPELAHLTHAARLAMPTDASGAAAPDISAAALAALLSGTASEADHHRFVDVAAQSTAVRLDAESALAFVEGIEQSMTAAPAHFVNEMLAGGSSDATQPVPGHGMSAAGCIRSAIFGKFGNRRWRVATVGAVLVLAGGLAWSLREPAPDAPPAQPAVATTDDACATRDAVTIAKTGANMGAKTEAAIAPNDRTSTGGAQSESACPEQPGHLAADPSPEAAASAARQQAEAARRRAETEQAAAAPATRMAPATAPADRIRPAQPPR